MLPNVKETMSCVHTSLVNRAVVCLTSVLVLIASMHTPLSAQTPGAEPPAMRAVRMNPGERVAMDGSLTSPAWLRAPVFKQFTEHQPKNGQAAQFETRVQVLFDDQALYFGIAALDPHPAARRATMVRHDQVFRTQDFLVVYVDAVGLKKSAQFYRVNALGVTADGTHTADNDNEDFSPDHDFEAASHITPQGFTAVFRIPYSGLRFSSDSAQPWRVMVGRRIPREQVVLDLSVPLSKQANHFIANMQRLDGFTPPGQQQFLQLRPTFTARAVQDDNGAVTTRESQVKVSLDAKYRPNAQWVLDAVLNPDFSQVALDVPQLSRNSRFALLSNEKRPVFLESRDLLNSPTDAIYTRAIHDPRWVTRASFRGEGASSTALLAHDKGGGLILLPGTYGSGAAESPANNTALGRFRRDADGLSWGALGAVRQYAGGAGEHSHAALDWRVELADGWRTVGQLGASNTSAWANASGKLTEQHARRGTRTHLGLSRRAQHWDLSASVDAATPDFRNDAGFASQSGYRQLNGEIKYKAENISLGGLQFNELHAYVQGRHVADAGRGASRGDTVSGWLTPGVWVQTSYNVDAALDVRGISLARSDAQAPLMREKYLHAWAQYLPGGRVTVVEGYADVGQLSDYAAHKTRGALRWGMSGKARLHPRLELEPRVDQLRLRASGGGLALEETAVQVLGIWHVQPRHSIRLIAQSSLYRRQPDPAAGLNADESRNHAQSMTYIWRQSNAQALYVGANSGGQQRLAAAKTKGAEAFVKWQFEL